ncbi:MAG: helix-turn-helix transcriptional regulator [Nanoarchaeota archaeon]|nr:helix-turn-helix transcriptional regulator [Nanoarchaeota archaeon]
MRENKCPVEKIVKLFGQKWMMLILKYLGEKKTLRFNEFIKLLPQISPRTLSKRLLELEEEDFINKKKFKEIPPKVEYTLTKKGKEFSKYFGEFNKLILKYEK